MLIPQRVVAVSLRECMVTDLFYKNLDTRSVDNEYAQQRD